MSTTDGTRLPVAELLKLKLASHDWLRLDILVPNSVDSRSLLSAEYRGALPLPAAVGQRGRLGDLVGTFWATVYLVSDRFKEVLEGAALSGWTTFPVAPRERLESGLWLLGVTGRCGPVYGVDGVARAGLDPVGQYLDPDEWDGADVFLPRNRNVVLLTPEAGRVLGRARLMNVDLEPGGLEATP